MDILSILASNPGLGGRFDPVNGTFTMKDPGSGQLVTMDLGTNDVHIDAALTNYINGYRPAMFMADTAMPVTPVNKQSNFYFQFDPDNALATVDGTQVAPGANPPEVTPKLSNTRYATLQYALAGFLPTELLSNQDAPLNLQMTTTRMIMDKILLGREVRVKNVLYSTANFTTPHLVDLTLDATKKWNGGANSDPIKDIQQLQEAALMPITDMLMSLDTWNAFTRNSNVQKFTAYKQAVQGLPLADQRQQFAAFLNLPRIHVAEVRAKNFTTGAYPYVWAGDVILFRNPEGGTQVSEVDITTAKTFRWNGAGGDSLPTDFGGVVNPGGLTVRSYFHPFRGTRGGYFIVVTHNDAEQFISQNVGGLIHGAFQ